MYNVLLEPSAAIRLVVRVNFLVKGLSPQGPVRKVSLDRQPLGSRVHVSILNCFQVIFVTNLHTRAKSGQHDGKLVINLKDKNLETVEHCHHDH